MAQCLTISFKRPDFQFCIFPLCWVRTSPVIISRGVTGTLKFTQRLGQGEGLGPGWEYGLADRDGARERQVGAFVGARVAPRSPTVRGARRGPPASEDAAHRAAQAARQGGAEQKSASEAGRAHGALASHGAWGGAGRRSMLA